MVYRGLILIWLLVCFHFGFSHEAKPDLTVLIPMRDGTELPTDLYFPSLNNGQKPPCILVRIPPGRKAAPWLSFTALSQAGYLVAMQDTRSSLDKEGKTFPFWSDGWGRQQDGYDAVEWLAKSPFTNGQIGTCGFSAAGITQLMLAPTTPPSLKCQYIGMAWGSLYHHGIYPGGQALKNQIEGWLGLHAKDTGVMSHVVNQPFYNDFWHHFNTTHVSHRVNVPALIYTGWFDTALQGTIDAYLSRQNHGGEGAKGKQKLVIGPWTHYWHFSDQLGDFRVPENAKKPDLDISPNRWFDYYLKQVDNGVNELSVVTYYVMGPFDGTPSSGNVWRHADQWPVPSHPKALYLTPDNKLSWSQALKGKGLSFVNDPKHPVPTIGGHNLFLDAGPMDQRPIEGREDVLSFTSDTLEEDLEVTGQVVAKLFIHSDCQDTDVAVRLTDVYPDGRSILITDGLTRTGHLQCLKGTDCTEKPQEISVDLLSTSLVFAKGHRIRVLISSSNFPRYEVNKNIGVLKSHTGESHLATNTLHLGSEHASRIILPIVNTSQ